MEEPGTRSTAGGFPPPSALGSAGLLSARGWGNFSDCSENSPRLQTKPALLQVGILFFLMYILL